MDRHTGKPKYRVGTRLVNAVGIKFTIMELITEDRVLCYRLDNEGIFSARRAERVLKRLCRSCDYPREDHAKQKKCIYGPGKWTL